MNRNLVLNLIKSVGPVSRKEIADRSGLSPATVSNLTAELIADGLVHEMGTGETARGRPPVLLRLNNRAGFVVGVKLMSGSLASVVTDLDATVLDFRSVTLPVAVGRSLAPTRAISAIADVVEASVARAGVRRSQLLGVGVGLAGLVDGAAGVCRYSPFFGWRNVNLVGPLRVALGLDEVFVDNDVNALAIAEQWFGHGHAVDHFAVVTVGAGVGLGLVVHGQFYRGAGGAAGELGHITVAPGGPRCGCGKSGCLEALASDTAVLNQIRAAISVGQSTRLRPETLNMDAVVAAADAGDELARQVLAESGRWLGIGLATVANVICPELVIVGGEGVSAGHWRLDPMREALAEHAFDDLASRIHLVVEPAGDEAWARGAACLVLGELFKSPLHERSPVPVPTRSRQVAGIPEASSRHSTQEDIT